MLPRHLVGAGVSSFVLPDRELHQLGEEDVDGGEAELVQRVDVPLVLFVLQQHLHVIQVHVLRRHVQRRAVQVRVEVPGAGAWKYFW